MGLSLRRRYPVRNIGWEFVAFNAMHIAEARRRRRGALAPARGARWNRKKFEKWCERNAWAMVPWIRKRLRRELKSLKKSLPPTSKVWLLSGRPKPDSR